MKLLTEISEKTLGLADVEVLGQSFTLRKSARAIVLNEAGEMAVQYLQNYTYHKLPGGGVDAGETEEEAVRREVREEVGCDCEIIAPIGMTIEYRTKIGLIHLSYGYVAKVVGAIGETALEAGEIEEGQITKWLPPAEVLANMELDEPQKVIGTFILEREKTFLREYLKG